LGSSSIASLLLYFYGAMPLRTGVGVLLVPAALVLAALSIGRLARASWSPSAIVRGGVWAGGFATLAYDLVRVPLAHGGVPVFNAISYFGTVILGIEHPTPLSEVVGWTYHLSNGVGFAIMYLALASRPRWFTAVAWGVGLECAMLVTPYAEVFGYKRSLSFIAISLSAHVVYGLALWWAATRWIANSASGYTIGSARKTAPIVTWLAVPVGLSLIAGDFFLLHARTIPDSPPPDIGPNLFVTWSTPEPDRVGAMWLMKRFVNPLARFRFIEPMSAVRYGTPFDMPEADIRRGHAVSTFETVLPRTGHGDDLQLKRLARFCHASEITPWSPNWDGELQRMSASYAAATNGCLSLNQCGDAAFAWFEREYRASDLPPLAR
jgi:hypothetical protein